MKKKIFTFLCVLILVFPCIFLFSACNKDKNPKETGFSVYIGDTIASSEHNSISVEYGAKLNWDNLISVKVNYDNNTEKNISYGGDGYQVLGLPSELNANLEGYDILITYGKFESVSLKLIVTKAQPNYTVPTSLTAEIGDTLSSITLPDGFSWLNPNDSVGEEGQRVHLATFTPQDLTNYEVVNNIEITITVEKLTPDYQEIGELSATYGTAIINVQLPTEDNGVWSWEAEATTPVGGVGENIFVAVFTPSDTDTYKTIKVNVTINVSPRAIDIPTISGTYTYNGQEQQAELVGCDYERIDVSGNVQTNANPSGYKITLSLKDKANFVWKNNSTEDVYLTWIINKAQATIAGTLSMNGWTYGENSSSPSGLSSSYNIVYMYRSADNETYSTIAPVNAGTYYVKGVIEETNNYIGCESNEVSFTISKKEVEPPSASGGILIFSGEEQGPVLSNTDFITYTGDTLKTEIGNYTITASLKDKTNCEWTTGGTENISISWSIVENPFDSITIDSAPIDFADFNSLIEIDYNSVLNFTLKQGFTMLIDNSEANSVTLNYNDEQHTIVVKSGEDTIYTKTVYINQTVNPISHFLVNNEVVDYEEFISNPTLNYQDILTIVYFSKYEDDFTDSIGNNYCVRLDFSIFIYDNQKNGEATMVANVVCNYPFVNDLTLDGAPITLTELCNKKAISYGSNISFTVNSQYEDTVEISVTEGGGQQTIVTGSYSYTFDNIYSYFYITVMDKINSSLILNANINTLLFETITINNIDVNISDIGDYYTYNRDYNENLFTISIDMASVPSNIELYYHTTNNYNNKVKYSGGSIALDSDYIGEELYIYARDVSSGEGTRVMTINFADFCPVNFVVVSETVAEDKNPNQEISINNHEMVYSTGGFITSLDVVFIDAYQACTFKVFDSEGVEVVSFTNASNTTYTIKVYLDGDEIYSCILKIQYNFNLVANESILNIGENGLIVTSNNSITSDVSDTTYFTEQVVTFNGKQTLTLVEGQNEVKIVYTLKVEGVSYTYKTNIIVEYKTDLLNNYITNLTLPLKENNGYEYYMSFNSDYATTNGGYHLAHVLRADAESIQVTTIGTVEVVSKSIQFSVDNAYAWIELVLLIEGENKTFRVYIDTYGSISSNTNFEVEASDLLGSSNVTDQISDNALTVTINVDGEIYINCEDSYATVEFYKDGVLVSTTTSNQLDITSSGIYTVKVISSDKTAEKELTITVNFVPSVNIVEVNYEDTNLYLEFNANSDMPSGNIDFIVGQQGIVLIGYLGEKQLDGTSVEVSIESVYANDLYYADGVTKITSSIVELDIYIDTDDGQITGVAQAKYAWVKVIDENEGMIIDFYIVFANRPEKVYPLALSFDTNGDSQITAEDYSIDIRLDLLNIYDLGDLLLDDYGPYVTVSRENLGMDAEDTSVGMVAVWQEVYDDYSYNIFLSEPSDNDVGYAPSLDNNKTETINITFEDGVATIYIIAEGSTTVSEYVPVKIILTD